MRVLVTGGAGFIGSFIVDELVARGHKVRVFDNLEKQVHKGKTPGYLNKKAEYVTGDIRDREAVAKALDGIEVVFHEASMVGVGQSMYEIHRFTDVNTLGTANLLDVIINTPKIRKTIKKLIVASSTSTYGEGAYLNSKGEFVNPSLRPLAQLKKKDWELHDPTTKGGKGYLKHILTPEYKKQECNSIYALTKKDQEEMCLIIGRAYNIPTVALRYFCVYGPRQSLSNPYTGVCAVFNSRIKNNNSPLVFEDGLQTRDFVNVRDIAQANILAMEKSAADYEVLNVGTGVGTSIAGLARTIAKIHKKKIEPKILNEFRAGDVRHCNADISKIKKLLGYAPKYDIESGLRELFEWAKDKEAIDLAEEATKELREKGLII